MTLTWSVPDLMKNPNRVFSIDESVSVDDVKERDAEIRDISPVNVTGHAEMERDVITFFLEITGRMILPCALTLEDVDYPFRIQTSEMFRLKGHPVIGEHDVDVHEAQDQRIDLLPFIKEAILVEKPLRVVAGNAVDCPAPKGEGWRMVTAAEQEQRIDPRFEKLKRLFDE
ncbi:YceD family protein [Camelliibacillus cellulosilyticus]|uniref:YceD family protein n=1 Tax=Camelliibacillus cellulosilyticus TaxID=2174486 RepID=A0ABV9GJF1_9BACL